MTRFSQNRVFAALVFVLAIGASACSSDNSGEAVATDELQPIVDAWAERNEVSELAVSVVSPSGSVTAVGYSADGEAPADTSLFIIASVAKPMVAATTLLLVEEGVLDLDEPIEHWLPDFPRADEITLRQLLSDKAGLPEDRPRVDLDALGPAALAKFEETRTPSELLVEAANRVGNETLPAAYKYSNAGFWVVAAVIESAVGESLAQVMRAQVSEPLQMTDTYVAWPESVDNQLVGGELTLPDGIVLPLGTEIVPAIMSQGWGAGGVLSSARDVATFYGALFDDLLAPSSVEAMKTTSPDSGGYGLGIDTEQWPGGATGWGTGGAALGYTTAAGVTDDGWSVAVLTNHFDLASNGTEPRPMALVGEVLMHIGAKN